MQGWKSKQARLPNHTQNFMKMLIKFSLPRQGEKEIYQEKKKKKEICQDVSGSLTWATVGSEVAIAVPTACGAAIDGAVIVIVASVRPRVCQPGLCSGLTDVEKSWPEEKKYIKQMLHKQQVIFLIQIASDISNSEFEWIIYFTILINKLVNYTE